MIKEVTDIPIYLNNSNYLCICIDCFKNPFKIKTYYDNIKKEYFLSDGVYKKYINSQGFLSRLDGKASRHGVFHIDGAAYYPIDFAEETNHLICKKCYNFCKQRCFI